MIAPWKKSYDQPRQHIKKQRRYFANNGSFSQTCSFSSSHVWMWELDYKESWAPKNWCFWTVMLEKTLQSPLNCKEIQPVHSKRNQSWIFFGRTNAEAGTTVLWPPSVKNWLIGKDPDAEKDWSGEEKSMTEDEMVGWHHQLYGHEFKLNSGSWWWTGKSGVLQSMGSLSLTWLSNWTEFPGGASGKEPTGNAGDIKKHSFHPWVRKNPLEEETATHSSIIVWRIPLPIKPGGLQSMGSQSPIQLKWLSTQQHKRSD